MELASSTIPIQSDDQNVAFSITEVTSKRKASRDINYSEVNIVLKLDTSFVFH